MLTEEIIIGLGLVMIIAIMALILNPPEALIKRVYHGKSKPGSDGEGDKK